MSRYSHIKHEQAEGKKAKTTIKEKIRKQREKDESKACRDEEHVTEDGIIQGKENLPRMI